MASQPIPRSRKKFKFESFWIANAQCEAVVKAGWHKDRIGTPMFEVVQCIANTRISLNKWQRSTFGNRGKEIDGIRNRLEVLKALPFNDDNKLESVSLHGRLDALLLEEHAYWSQRAKILWLTEGEKNSKVFHRKASNRRSKNCITSLFDDNGTLQESEQGVEQVVLDYFGKMFSAYATDQLHMEKVIALIPPKVTASMNIALLAPFSAEEINKALFQMYPTKSPGPDGMPSLFFQQYWDTIGPEVTKAVASFLSTGKLLEQINYTHICLIPKVARPKKMSELRPIALCNVIYKICSKAITSRLKKILGSIISPFQSAFIPGRLISDNTLVANEVSHFIHTNSSKTNGVFSLKLDMHE